VGSTIAALIVSTESGDRSAADALFSALYAELHELARRQLAREGAGAALGVTTLLHEAYLNIAEREGPVFPDRARFMGYAAKVMRSLIIDNARRRGAQKRGGAFEITTLDEEAGAAAAGEDELIQIGSALEDLTRVDPTLTDLVDLRFFCGFSFAEIARMRGVSERTVQRSWETARVFLHRKIREGAM
jgi:RNA polymerase sigma factor (TIGR02999 family)